MNRAISNSDYQTSTILLVDDEPINIKLLEKILRNAGYKNLLTTTNPLDSLAICRQHHVDLILLDLNMPVMDGFQVMDLLHSVSDTLLNLPYFIIVTAQTSQEFCNRSLHAGARDFVTKPFNNSEMLMRVSNLLEMNYYQGALEKDKQSLEVVVRERTEELQRTRLQVIRYLGRAAEYRDNETGFHILRMSNIAAQLAMHMGMSAEQTDLLLNASPMHDIGKIGIPDNILLKPGKLDDEEWKIMRMHPEIGGEILNGDDSELMAMAHDIAIAHHERWDGKGYPFNLREEEIPLTARISTVADVFDALTSARPYKKAWPVQQAIAYINELSGKQFDPKVVEAFNDCRVEIAKIAEKYKEPEAEEATESTQEA